MKIIKYEQPIAGDDKGVIFLAGPTVRGNQQHLRPSWREEAVKILGDLGFKGTVIIPEFTDPFESDKGRADLPLWEFSGMCEADVIVFWIPRTRELIGLTTNFEIGYWLGVTMEDGIVYGRPDNSYRNEYIDIMWDKHRPNGHIHNSLSRTLSEALEQVTRILEEDKGQEPSERTDGGCTPIIPDGSAGLGVDIGRPKAGYAIFHGKGGYPREREEAEKVFEVGKFYKVKYGVQHRWSCELYFDEVAGSWNSALFLCDVETCKLNRSYYL